MNVYMCMGACVCSFQDEDLSIYKPWAPTECTALVLRLLAVMSIHQTIYVNCTKGVYRRHSY